MCGRYGLALSEEELRELFEGADLPEGYQPRFNIAPTQDALVARAAAAGPELVWARWGLIPYGEDAVRAGARHINARSETAAARWPFRDAFARRRCLVPASGFYEWRASAGGKLPYWIQAAGPLTLAGLWEAGRGGDPPSFTILTRDAPAGLAHIHDRVPVVVAPQWRRAWLDNQTPAGELQTVVRDLPPPLRAHPVSRRVNRAGEDDPGLVEPVDEPLELPLE